MAEYINLNYLLPLNFSNLYATVDNMSNSKFLLHYLSSLNFEYDRQIISWKMNDRNLVTTQVQSSEFTVQWLFAEPLRIKCGFFMSRLAGLGMDNGSWLQAEPLNCEP